MYEITQTWIKGMIKLQMVAMENIYIICQIWPYKVELVFHHVTPLILFCIHLYLCIYVIRIYIHIWMINYNIDKYHNVLTTIFTTIWFSSINCSF